MGRFVTYVPRLTSQSIYGDSSRQNPKRMQIVLRLKQPAKESRSGQREGI
jgi:hypothetical protein